MLSKSIEQLNLFSMDKYINDLIHLYENNKPPNKIYFLVKKALVNSPSISSY